jgi:hypothetical protein
VLLPLDEADRVCGLCGGGLHAWEGQGEDREEVTVVERSFLLRRNSAKVHSRRPLLHPLRSGRCLLPALASSSPAWGNFQGVAFQGPRQLATLLKEAPAFAECMSRKALAYGLGRELTDADWPVVRNVNQRFAQGGHRLPELLVAVAMSESFRNRCPVPAEQ